MVPYINSVNTATINMGGVQIFLEHAHLVFVDPDCVIVGSVVVKYICYVFYTLCSNLYSYPVCNGLIFLHPHPYLCIFETKHSNTSEIIFDSAFDLH